MSKLTKLVRHPKRFVLDSKPYRRYLLLASRGANNRPVRLEGESFSSSSELTQIVLEDLAQRVPLLDLSHDGTAEVAVLREDLHRLTNYLFDASRSDDIEVTILAKRRPLAVSSLRLLEIDDHIGSLHRFVVRFTSPSKGLRAEIGFDLWKNEDGHATGPSQSIIAKRISQHTIDDRELFREGELKHARTLHDAPLIVDVDFPVDVVYTWVNHHDAQWKQLYAEKVGAPPEAKDDDAQSIDRFMNRDELMYSLRSLDQYAKWVRTIFVVTNCARPAWLSEDPRVVWIDHRDIIPEAHLPTFSSHAIESRLHHIPGLANHFVYFNDDFFLTRPTSASDFFFANGISMSAMEEYGAVNGAPHPADPDYLNAARNGKHLIEQAFGRAPTALHKHTPYSLRKDVLLEMEDRFQERIANTTARAFRHIDDISTVSFLYHHYAFLTGRAVYVPRDAWLIKPKTPRYERKLAQLVTQEAQPFSLCLNDGGGSVGHSNWDRHVVEVLNELYPEKAGFES